MLIKGPIVYAFLLPGLVAFEWRRRKTKTAGTAWSGWMPWLAFVFGFSSLGGGRNSFRAGIHRARGLAGIRRTLQRSRRIGRNHLFLFAAPASSVRAVELVAVDAWVLCAEKKQRRLDSVSPYQSGNILAGGLEFGRPSGDVVCSVEKDRPDFPGRAAPLFVTGGCGESTERKTKSARGPVLRHRDRSRGGFHERIHGSENLGGASRTTRRLCRFRPGGHCPNNDASMALRSGRRGRRRDAFVCSADGVSRAGASSCRLECREARCSRRPR